jgi:hypothetical protein
MHGAARLAMSFEFSKAACVPVYMRQNLKFGAVKSENAEIAGFFKR